MTRKSTGRKQAAHKSVSQKQKVRSIPSGYHVVTPYLSVRGAAEAIDFYKKALGANEVLRMPGPDGKLGHAEIQIGDSRVMLSDEHEAMDFVGPKSLGGTSVHIHLYVNDADAAVEKAAAAGAMVLREVEDKFYGDRSGTIEDPFGHIWHISTHTVDVPIAAIKERAAELAQAAAAGQVQPSLMPAA